MSCAMLSRFNVFHALRTSFVFSFLLLGFAGAASAATVRLNADPVSSGGVTFDTDTGSSIYGGFGFDALTVGGGSAQPLTGSGTSLSIALSQDATISSVSIVFQNNAQGVEIDFLHDGVVQKTIGPNLSGSPAVNACANEIRIVDRNASSSGGLDLQDVNFTVGACAVNSAPILGGTPADDTATEDLATAIDLSAYNISDADGDTVTLTLGVSRGSIASVDGNGTTSGVTVASSGTASMTLQGTAANLNTYLNDTSKITFTTAANDTTAATLTVTPNDGTENGVADTVTITVSAVNDDPTATGVPSDLTVTEDTQSNIDLSAVTFADVDSATMTVTLTASAGTFAAPVDGAVTETLVSPTVMTLAGGPADISTYLDTASNIQYTGASDVFGNNVATLSVVGNDGDGSGNVSFGTVNIDITSVNDAPTVTSLGGDSVDFLQGNSPQLIDLGSNAAVADIDSTDFSGGNLTVSTVANEDATEDQLSFDTSGAVSLSGTTGGSNVSVSGTVVGTLGNNIAVGNDLVVNFGANATPARAQALIRAITYQNTDTSNPTANTRTVRVTVNDGDGATSSNADVSVVVEAADADGALTAAGGVSEPVGLDTTVDSVGEAVDLFDFTLSDGGAADGLPLTVSQITVNVSGTAGDTVRDQITWRLNGNDASNVTGTYNAGADTITFSGLSISIADGGSETYTVNGYYNDNTNLTEDQTIILSVDGDTDVTVGSGTSMGATSAVTNGAGATVDVTATSLAFSTQPAGSTSGSALSTQPVVAAQDGFGNTDTDFTETVTLTEASAGSLTNNTQAAVSGVATFTALNYTATADQQSFTLTANDQDGVGSDLPTVDANSVTSDVVATKLVFDTQPAPAGVPSGVAFSFTTVPAVSAKDANDVVDTGYFTDITLLEVNGAGSATLSGTGDTDGSGATVSITPSSGSATYTGLQITYTPSGAGGETFNLRATSGGLTTADSTLITTNEVPAFDQGATASLEVNEDATAASINGLLATTDGDSGDTLTWSVVSAPSKGALAGLPANATSTGASVSPTGVTYTPNADATGADSFDIQVSDGSNTDTLTINVAINARPTVAITSAESGSTNVAPFDVTATFNESVTGFASTDVVVGNGSVDSVTGSGTTYTVTVTPAAEGSVTVDIPANGATDADAAGNEAATQFAIDYDATPPTLSAIDLTDESDTGINNDDLTRDTTPTISFSTENGATLDVDWGDGNGFVNAGAGTGSSQEVTLASAYTTDGDKTIDVRATDSAGNNATESLTISIDTAAPVAVADAASLDEDTAIAIDVLANDSNAAGTINPASVAVVTPTAEGRVALATATGKVTYTPSPNFNGTDSFTYRFENLAGTQSNTATVTLTIEAANDAPLAINDLADTALDSSITIDVLANDSDVDAGDTLDGSTLALTGTASNGLATVESGQVLYTPNVGFSGIDSFRYRVRDDNGAFSNEATVRINVTGANSRPVANDDSATLDEDDSATINLLANDSDADGTLDADSVQIVSNPENGSVSLSSGSATYTPNADFNGTDSFTYVVADDGGALSAGATVTLTVNGVDDAPRVADDTAEILGQVLHSVNVLGNDSDVDGSLNVTTVVIVDSPAQGVASVDPVTGAIGYTPGGGFTSQDSLTYTVQDNTANVSEKATLTLQIAGLNEAPQAVDDATTLDEDDSVTVSVLGNDIDADGNIDASSLTITAAPSNGIASVNGSGEIDYQPDANFNGTDQLQYTVADESGAPSNPATVVFTVDPVNDEPTISGTPATEVFEGVSYSFTPSVADQDGDSLTISASGQASWLTFDASTGLLQGTPEREDAGATSTITMSVSDGNISTQLASFSLAVIPDLDRDGTRDSQDDDRDGDGLTNEFENRYGFDPDDNTDAAGDLDNDGLSNVDEELAGTDPTTDDQPPVLTPPDTLVLDATGLLTSIGSPDAPLATDALDGPVTVSLVTTQTQFSPGVHALTWTAQDAAGNSASINQRLEVNPLISLGKNQVQVEGASATVRFLLNGTAPNYPVTVDYEVAGTTDGSDHDLTAGSVIFAADALEASVPVAITDDALLEGRETLIVRLTGDGNFGAKQEHVLTVVEENIAPRLDLSVTQGGQEIRIISQGGGDAMFTATVIDPNPADTHRYEWNFPRGAIATTGDDPMQGLDPLSLAPGVYQARVTVTDDGAPILSATMVQSFRIVAVAPVLSNLDDSDGDGIDDATEGLTDTDRDGQPDYLDSVPLANVLNESSGDENRFLIEADPGVKLKLGNRALGNNSDGAQLLQEEIEADTTIPSDTVINVGGYFDMVAEDLPTAGDSVNIVFPQRLPVPESPVYRKFINGEWINFVENGRNILASAAGEEGACPPPGSSEYEPGLSEGDWCVQLTIEDGGPNDADGAVNSSVEDPGGVGTQPDVQLSTSSGGGGAMNPWFLALGVIALLRSRRKSWVLLAAMLAVSASAKAESHAESWLSADRFSVAAQGMYVTSSQNANDFRRELSNGGFDPEVSSYDENRLGFSLEADYRYWQSFSLAVGYVDFGDVDADFTANASNAEALRRAIRDAYALSGDGWTLAQVFTHPVTERLNARVELGLLRWEGEVDTTMSELNSKTGTEIDAFLGLGLNYKIIDQVQAGIQVRNYNVAGQDLMSWGLRVSYSFGY